MRPVPQKCLNDASLYVSALHALVRRAYSVFEMRAYLACRAENPALVRRVVTRLRHEKLLDDARYALEFARSRANFRRQGPFRIVRELRARGVPDRHIDTAIAQAFAETNEADLVRKLIERKVRALRGPLDTRKMVSLHRTLLRAGFDAALISRELRAAGATMPNPAPDIPDLYAAEGDN